MKTQTTYKHLRMQLKQTFKGKIYCKYLHKRKLSSQKCNVYFWTLGKKKLKLRQTQAQIIYFIFYKKQMRKKLNCDSLKEIFNQQSKGPKLVKIENSDFSANLTQIKRSLKKKPNNYLSTGQRTDEIDKFLKRCRLPKLTQKLENQNRPMTRKLNWQLKLPTVKSQDQHCFTG